MTDEDIVAALAEALTKHRIEASGIGEVACSCNHEWQSPAAYRKHIARDVALPVVHRVAEQRAAEELLAAADWFNHLFHHGEANCADEPKSHMKSCAFGRNIAYRRAAIRLEDRAAALTASPNHGTDPTT